MMYYAVHVEKEYFAAPAVNGWRDLPGLRLHKDPLPYLEAMKIAERAAIKSCAKASGGRKGQWHVVRHGDVFVKERVQVQP